MSWVNSDEMGVETITAIVQTLLDDSILWEAVAEPIPGCSLPAKRICHCIQTYDEIWLVEPSRSSHDDVIIEVHVPYTRTRLRTPIPPIGDNDFAELEEMLVELKLMITKKFLGCGLIPERISLLSDVLSRFTSSHPSPPPGGSGEPMPPNGQNSGTSEEGKYEGGGRHRPCQGTGTNGQAQPIPPG
ncbi:hypothetical protein NECAME_02064 [Necator americanus]|uniref:Uncharacterized protein n=1 Tax=Necator americanus TaxID=51031 RepID=W2TJJ8_NECAM|nr:hypothetical protein NECAME_02064 [Necator americanus]ETN81774.1 hypothetical protein NECAME_02064 [Necator americanus]